MQINDNTKRRRIGDALRIARIAFIGIFNSHPLLRTDLRKMRLSAESLM